MYVDDHPLAQSRLPVRRKLLAPGPSGGSKVFVDMAERPFCELGDDDLLDSGDLCRLFGCSLATLYRWISAHDLPRAGWAGREALFKKRAILDWARLYRPRRGRPPLQPR